MAKYFEETFVSGFNSPTKERAFEILEEIRKCHPATSGWQEVEAGVRENYDGTYTAYRRHRKII